MKILILPSNLNSKLISSKCLLLIQLLNSNSHLHQCISRFRITSRHQVKMYLNTTSIIQALEDHRLRATLDLDHKLRMVLGLLNKLKVRLFNLVAKVILDNQYFQLIKWIKWILEDHHKIMALISSHLKMMSLDQDRQLWAIWVIDLEDQIQMPSLVSNLLQCHLLIHLRCHNQTQDKLLLW